jgi:outer membrane protein assembly factor BamA
VRFTVVFEGNVWDDVVAPPVVTVKAGDAFKPSTARGALEELLKSGRFARGRVTAEPEGGGVAVVARVVPRKLIGRLDLELHGARLDQDDLLRTAELSVSGEIIGADVGATNRRIERYFALHGYPSAKAILRMTDTDDPMRTLVLVDVTPGRPRLVDERDFYVFGARPEQVLPTANTYAVVEKDRADEPALDQADAGLAQALRSKGWHRAEVTHDLVWVSQPGRAGRVVLRVRIDTGPLFVARFEGNEHYDDDVLAAALDIEGETDRSTAHLADKIREFYEKRGFLDTWRVETRGGDKDAVELLVFHVDEESGSGRLAQLPCLGSGHQAPARGGPTSASRHWHGDRQLPPGFALVDLWST